MFTCNFCRSTRATPVTLEARTKLTPNRPCATPSSQPHGQATRPGRSAAPHALLTASWPCDEARRPASAQNNTSELVAHSGRVLPTDGGSCLANSVSLLDNALNRLVGASLARALHPHGREVHVGREGLLLLVRTPVARVLVAVLAAWPREPSPTRLRQEGLCPP